MGFLKDRLSEGSTYAGLAAAMIGFGQIFDFAEAPLIADGLTQIGQAPSWSMAIAVIGGVVAMLLRDKGTK